MSSRARSVRKASGAAFAAFLAGAIAASAAPAVASGGEKAGGHGRIDGAHLVDGSVTYPKLGLADGEVPLAKVRDAASQAALDRLEADVQAGASALHCTGCVLQSHIGSGAVGTAQVLDRSINAAKIGVGNVTDEHLATGLSASKITHGTLGGALVGPGIDAGHITHGQIDVGLIPHLDASKLTGVLDLARIMTGSITGDKLALASDKDSSDMTDVLNPSGIRNEHVEPGTLQGDRLRDGAVAGGKLADGAVSPRKSRSNVALAAHDTGYLSASSPERALAPATLTVADGTSHVVLLTGQVAAACECDEPITVRYQIRRTSGANPPVQISPQYQAVLPPGAQMVLPISAVDPQAPPGTSTYELHVLVTSAGSGGVLLSGAVLTAVDLGR